MGHTYLHDSVAGLIDGIPKPAFLQGRAMLQRICNQILEQLRGPASVLLLEVLSSLFGDHFVNWVAPPL